MPIYNPPTAAATTGEEPAVIIGSANLTDEHTGKNIHLNNTDPAILTVMPQDTGAWQDYAVVEITQLNGFDVTIAPGSGVTLNSYENRFILSGPYASAVLRKISENNWILTGNLIISA